MNLAIDCKRQICLVYWFSDGDLWLAGKQYDYQEKGLITDIKKPFI